jgi:hypothetical protein
VGSNIYTNTFVRWSMSRQDNRIGAHTAGAGGNRGSTRLFPEGFTALVQPSAMNAASSS